MVKVSCKVCGKQCKGEVLKLQENFYHISCFKCHECKRNIANESFFTHDGKYYCESDYGKKFGAACAACNRVVDESSRAVAALGKTFHEHCFRCAKCNGNFRPGDKVSLVSGKHLCGKCASPANTSTPRTTGQPINTSTPIESKPQKTHAPATTAAPHSKPAEKSMGYVSGPEGVDSMGASDMEDGDLINPHPRYHSPGLSADETFSELSTSRHFSPRPTADVTNHTVDGSRYSRNKTVQFEPKFRSNFGQHLTGSYLEHGLSYLRRGGSMPPAGAPASNPNSAHSPHFSRPENFSYRNPTRRFIRSKKGGLVQLTLAPGVETNARATNGREAGEIKQEAIKMSHFASGRPPTPQEVPPIERDDFPAPPAPVNVIGNRLRKKQPDDDETDATKTDPQLAKDLDQLEQLAKDHSGVAEIILRELQNKAAHAGELDPRSASRTPAANHEPGIPTRYMSAMFASPSRFSDHPRSGRFSSPPPGVLEGGDRHGATLAGFDNTRLIHPDEDFRAQTLPAGANANGQPPSDATRTQKRERPTERSHFVSESDLDLDNTMSYKQHYRAATLSDVCPTYLSEAAGLKHSLGHLPLQQPPQQFGYDKLKGGSANANLPKNIDAEHLEMHLLQEDFERVFRMSRDDFYRQPEWKQNDMKRRVDLY